MARQHTRITPYMDTRGAATYTGVSPRWLEALRGRGEGPVFSRLGRRVVYRVEDLDTWVSSRRCIAGAKGGR